MSPNREPFRSPLLWAVIAAALLFVLWQGFPSLTRQIGGATATPRVVTPRGDLAADEESTIHLFEHAKSSVVFITTRERVMDPWTRNIFSIPRGTGSGFIWDDQGHVVTNYHVVADSSDARVRLSDGREYKAALVGASRPMISPYCASASPSIAPRPCWSARARTSRSGRRCSPSATPSASTGH